MGVFRKIGTIFLDVVETIVIALAIFVIIYLFLFQPHQVRGSSMFPNFHDNDYLLTDKISYRLNEPKRGEVVIFIAPKNEEYDYIKRIIGLPKEKVSINKNNQILINDQKLDEYYLPAGTETFGGAFLEAGKTVTIPDDEYFVMGDNRSHSSDSRDWGFVPRKNIIGKAWLRYWPPKDMGLISLKETN
ncbi:MAG: signal peptidase I [Candidatus Shapirobacteria bacterium]|nr:signal peptidase I [Candidatus Shapirobacteria bacterium]